MPNPNTKGISVHVDRELHAEITAYLQEHNMKMGDFIALAAQMALRPPSPEIDPELRAEISAYMEEHDMTMGEFISLAAQDEMQPKITEMEVKEVGRMRTLAFQVNEDLFQRVKQYLERNNMTQKQFVIGLIEEELDRDKWFGLEPQYVRYIRRKWVNAIAYLVHANAPEKYQYDFKEVIANFDVKSTIDLLKKDSKL